MLVETPHRIQLTKDERLELTRISKKWTAPYREVIRAKIILLADRGISHCEIGRRLSLGRKNVSKWIKRYFVDRKEGLRPQPRKREERDQRVKRLLEILRNQPKSYCLSLRSWTLASLALVYGQQHGDFISRSTMCRLVKKTGYSLKKARREVIIPAPNRLERVGLLLTEPERRELMQVARKWVVPHHEVVRARIILLADQGLSYQEIGNRLSLSRKIVSKWVQRYLKQRKEGLRARLRPEHPKRIEARELCRKRILEILHDRPSSFGINRGSWSLASLALAYQKEYGGILSKTTVHRLVRKSGFTFRKARRVLTSPDPEYREKVELLLATLRNLSKDEFLFFIDEMGPLRVKKYGGRSLVRRSEVSMFPQEQKHKGSVIMSAALSATENQITWLYTRSKDTQAMIDLIEILFNQYHTARRLYMTWDAASWHRSTCLVQWLDTFNSETERLQIGPIIHVIPLPTSAQFLDVLEAVFSGMKRAVIHHSDYSNRAEMMNAISKHFSDRNAHFAQNPRRAGKKIWELDFFEDLENLKSGNYREW